MFGLRSNKKCFALALRYAGIAAALLLLAWYAEPFSPRYQGRTIRSWLNHNADHRRLPDRDMVRHFGDSAVPRLLRESQPSGFTSAAIALESIVRSERFDPLRAADFNRRMAAVDWAQMLLQVDPTVYTRLLQSTEDDSTAIELTRLFHGDRYLGQTLKTLSKQQTNAALQARADHLLQVYREAI